jgi:hypothetical protein
MATGVNIFEKYGIKEVANVYFEALENDKAANVYKGDIVLFLDTLKTSTIETTAETTDARGGWGNPKLISWDYGKEITVTLTDALISLESLRFMMGGAIKASNNGTGEEVWVRHTAEVVLGTGGILPLPEDPITKQKYAGEDFGDVSETHPLRVINMTTGVRTQVTSATNYDGEHILKFYNPAMGTVEETPGSSGDRVRLFWEEKVDQKGAAVEITISPNTFPGTYRIVGDTFIRSQKTGADEAFQFVINKAKVQSNVTLTLEAEGDPSTFEMTLTVLRDDSGDMMKLIRYGEGSEGGETSSADIGSIVSST